MSQQDLDDRVWNAPEYAVGIQRHIEAVKRIRDSGGVIYLPELSNIQSFRIGVGSKIHSHVWIGKEVKIGSNALIQAYAFIPDMVTLGDNVFIGPRVTFTNEKHPMSGVWLPTIVEDNVCIGAGAVILPNLTLGNGCIIGAGAVVTENVPPHEVWVGNPAKQLKRP